MPKAIRCACCHNKFTPDSSAYVLCYDCYQEYGLYGDETSSKMWRAVSVLINLPLMMDDLKALADTDAFTKFSREVFREKDLDTAITFYKQLIKDRK